MIIIIEMIPTEKIITMIKRVITKINIIEKTVISMHLIIRKTGNLAEVTVIIEIVILLIVVIIIITTNIWLVEIVITLISIRVEEGVMIAEIENSFMVNLVRTIEPFLIK